MSASCIVQCHKPINKNDRITKIRYNAPVGGDSGNYDVYFESHLYGDERRYSCVKSFIKDCKAPDFVKYVSPITKLPPTKGGRYYAEWEVKNDESTKT